MIFILTVQSATRAVKIMWGLEALAKVSFHFAFHGMVFFIPALGFYVVGGFLGTRAGVFQLSYPFLSLHEDPLFNLLTVTLGFLFCVANFTLLFLTAFADYNNDYEELIILSTCIGFGCGVGMIRMTGSALIDLAL